jgi:hypothetical protein
MSIEIRRTHEAAQGQEFSRIDYSRYIRTFERIGIARTLSDKQLGVIGADGREYPLPKQEQIIEIFKQNKDLIDEKKRQGFTKLLIVPYALPISTLIDITNAVILSHKIKEKLFQTKLNPQDPDESIKNDGFNPNWMMDNLEQKDFDSMIYLPSFFSRDHKGKTKQEVINDPKICAFPGWSIGLIENTPLLPGNREGKIIERRQQLETDLTPNDYLRNIKRQKESGWTPEDFLIDFITHLEETNQIRHNLSQFSGMWLTGTYLPSSSSNRQDYVPAAAWDSKNSKLGLFKGDPNAHNERWGTHSTVRLVFG